MDDLLELAIEAEPLLVAIDIHEIEFNQFR
jgi:hypothetical protein